MERREWTYECADVNRRRRGSVRIRSWYEMETTTLTMGLYMVVVMTSVSVVVIDVVMGSLLPFSRRTSALTSHQLVVPQPE